MNSIQQENVSPSGPEKPPGKTKLIRDISANTVQTGVTQLFGLVLFYVMSKYLSKNDFGEFNWSFAVGATLIAVGSLGLDLIFVKRIASGADVVEISGIHFFHTVLVGIVLSLAAFCIDLLVPSFGHAHPLFLLVFLNLSVANVANSFKLCMNGLEAYRRLAVLSVIINVTRLLLVMGLFFGGLFTVKHIVFAYLCTSVIEMLTGYLFMNRSILGRVRPLLRPAEYKYFLLESLPQLGVVVFDSALARIDWILLGILSTAAATAEYSFTYKIFELSKFPLVIIAPVLLTRFSKMFSDVAGLNDSNRRDIRFFFKTEIFLLMYIPLFLMTVWSPIMDYFTDGKYGTVNELSYCLLAVCVPLHGIINFLWTMAFVQSQLRAIFLITVSVSVLNILFNAFLIPWYGANGAASAFLVTTVIQLGLYVLFVKRHEARPGLRNGLWSLACAAAAYLLFRLTVDHILLRLCGTLALYTMLGLVFRQFDLKGVRHIYRSARWRS
jgi:O-antigen/teichoic acid export membrane protein